MEQIRAMSEGITRLNMDNMKKILNENISSITGKVICTLEDVRTGKIEIKEFDNLITNAGKVAIARRLVGIAELANEGKNTYGATGTDATAPLVTDTVLGTELTRKLKSSSSYVAGTRKSKFRVAFTTAESNGALKEFGLFGEAASGAADSGTMFEHAAIDIVKDNTKTLIIEVVITVN